MSIKTQLKHVPIAFLFSLIISMDVLAEDVKTYDLAIDSDCSSATINPFRYESREEGRYIFDGTDGYTYTSQGVFDNSTKDLANTLSYRTYDMECQGDALVTPDAQGFRITNSNCSVLVQYLLQLERSVFPIHQQIQSIFVTKQ